MSPGSAMPTSVVMMKFPQPGRVNTRLMRDGYSAEAAAAIALQMGRCVVDRLRTRGPVVLGVSPDGCGAELVYCLSFSFSFLSGRGHKGLKQWMGCDGLGFEFGMELHADKPRMIIILHYFHQCIIW